MTAGAAASGRAAEKASNFRGQLGRFRLNPTVAVSSSLTNTSQVVPPPAQSVPSSSVSPGSSSSIQHVENAVPASSALSTTSSIYGKRPLSPQSPEAGDRDGHGSKTKRVSTACEFCRKRKKKCDFRYPNCSACTRAGVVCTVLTLGQSVAHQPVPRDQIENLQKRVEWLEQTLRSRTGLDLSNKPTGANVAIEEGQDQQQQPPPPPPPPPQQHQEEQEQQQDPDQWFHVPTLLAQPRAGPGLSAQNDAVDVVNSPMSRPSSLPSLDGGQLPNISEIFRDKLENRRSSVPRPTSSAIPSVRRLSSWEEAERLVGQYFEGVGTQYPFLHKVEFMRGMRRIYSNQPVSPQVQNSYHMTIATALLTTTNDITQATAFYGAARQTLTPTLQNEDRVSLQALLSLALYSLSTPSGPSIWHVLGTAMRLATSLGLHKARPPPNVSTKDIREHEMDKRAFWSLYNLDRLISVTLSRPLGISDEDIVVDIPRELDDNWMDAPRNCSMSISVQVVQLRRIFSRIYRCFYNPHADPNVPNVLHLIEDFRQELDAWRSYAPIIESCVHYSTNYYDFLYNSALTLLYRPSILNPYPNHDCIVSCGNASILIIQSYSRSYSIGKIKWLWITLCHVYSAGVTILWCLEQNIRSLRQGNSVIWDNTQGYDSLDTVQVLLDEFRQKRQGADRLISQFKAQTQQVLNRMAEVTMEQQQQHQIFDQIPTNLMTPTDPMMMVNPLFYNYHWLGQEVASFYGL
ncbi:putative C6 transcription factor [Talaromyces proteolyticus]|uniref:C6 transcription factor n=1 Tax=Talaromyces proteolyticus TaxID=1131652 RepID=A0AAD4KX27_9EURO|nr:putative C6 transcription factor [Talaromyces proteolyticus]KAH8703121.1 putative C6 transcription factor [Talaromyces proteolyticus]